jgi:hypothetical protein
MEIRVDLFPEVLLVRLMWLDQGVALRAFWSAFLTDLKWFVMLCSGEERPPCISTFLLLGLTQPMSRFRFPASLYLSRASAITNASRGTPYCIIMIEFSSDLAYTLLDMVPPYAC